MAAKAYIPKTSYSLTSSFSPPSLHTLLLLLLSIHILHPLPLLNVTRGCQLTVSVAASMTLASSPTTTTAPPIIDLTRPDCNSVVRSRTRCADRGSAASMQTFPATNTSQGPGRNSSTEPRDLRDCIEVDVVDLTDTIPITPPASQCLELDARNSEAPTIRSQTPPPPSQQHSDLTERLADKEWAVAGILDLVEDLVQVSWAPARVELAYLYKRLYGIPLLNYVRRLDLLPNGLCDVQWVATWEPCEALMTTFADLAEISSGQLHCWTPFKIIDECCEEAVSRFLVKLRPSFYQMKDRHRFTGLSQHCKIFTHASEGFFIAVWDTIWASPGDSVSREMKWEEHWDDLHRDWTLHGHH